MLYSMSNRDDHTPAKIQQPNKRKSKEEEGKTTLSRRMNSKSTDKDHTNEPMIISPVPLKYAKVCVPGLERIRVLLCLVCLF